MTVIKEPPAFAQDRRAGKIVVDEPPKLDLDAYIANYKGRTRLERLLFIGITSTHLCPEALKAAVTEAKKGSDVQKYESAIAAMQEYAPNEPEVTTDQVWIEHKKRLVKAETDKMELELKGYKNNLIKESIRMGYDDLGQQYHSIGDLSNSNKSYAKMRDFCTTNSQVINMTMHLINVSIDQQNWFNVQSHVLRLRSGGTQKYPEATKNSAKLTAALGISFLASGSFREAAHQFINTDPRMVQAKFDDPADEESYNEVLTPNDVAVYGGLCALASMSREELQKNVLEHKTFRNYLELEPHIRRAISHFISSKYSACLSILDSYKADYLLDIYLHRHLHELYFQIRSKAIHQYFIPFSCVTLSALATAFNTDGSTIELELTQMIKHGHLGARIDLVDRVLLARKVDGRKKVHAEALKTAKEYERTTRVRMLRMAVLNVGLEVKGSKGQGAAGFGGNQEAMWSGEARDLIDEGRNRRGGVS